MLDRHKTTKEEGNTDKLLKETDRQKVKRVTDDNREKGVSLNLICHGSEIS